MTNQLEKDNFGWNQLAEEAIQRLKRAMTQVPVLALPNFSQPFMLETNASRTGLSAVLMQNQRPIDFYSQVLSKQARSKSVYERELMPIVLAVQKWRPCLLGRRFVVRINQKSLKLLLEQRVVSAEHEKWLSKLLGFDFEIQYCLGLENKVVDALSRMHLTAKLATNSFSSATLG